MQEQVVTDTAARASCGCGFTRQALRVAELASLRPEIVVAISRALLYAGIDLEVGPTVLNVGVLWVATQADRRLAIWAILARVVAFGVDGEPSGHLVDHVVESVVDQVEGGHLEGVRLCTCVGRSKARDHHLNLVSRLRLVRVELLDDILDGHRACR